MAPDNIKSIEIFYSYASTDDGIDEQLQQQLEKHLGVLKRQGKIANWHKRNILAGQTVNEELSKHLNSAQVILLLISPDFVASDQCWDIEMDRALERQKDEKTLVIPVLLRPLDYKEAPFSNLQVLPKNGKPVTSWSNQDEAFEDIARNIRLLAEEFEKTQRISWKNLAAGVSFAAAIALLLTSSTDTRQQIYPPDKAEIYIGRIHIRDYNVYAFKNFYKQEFSPIYVHERFDYALYELILGIRRKSEKLINVDIYIGSILKGNFSGGRKEITIKGQEVIQYEFSLDGQHFRCKFAGRTSLPPRPKDRLEGWYLLSDKLSDEVMNPYGDIWEARLSKDS